MIQPLILMMALVRPGFNRPECRLSHNRESDEAERANVVFVFSEWYSSPVRFCRATTLGSAGPMAKQTSK